MRKSSFIVPIVIISIIFAGCRPSTVTARLYRMDDGMVTNIQFTRTGTGHNRGTVTTPDGEVLEWEFSTISGESTSWGSIFGSSKTSSGNVSAYGWANAMGFSFNQPGVQYGSFVAIGNKGMAIDGVYAVSSSTNHGYGVGKDNKDRRYRLQF
jgi:hypothetical protein